MPLTSAVTSVWCGDTLKETHPAARLDTWECVCVCVSSVSQALKDDFLCAAHPADHFPFCWVLLWSRSPHLCADAPQATQGHVTKCKRDFLSVDLIKNSRCGPRPFYIACWLKVFHNSIDAFSNTRQNQFLQWLLRELSWTVKMFNPVEAALKYSCEALKSKKTHGHNIFCLKSRQMNAIEPLKPPPIH